MNVAVLGGTGLAALDDANAPAADTLNTPFGPASALPKRSPALANALFLNRHGDEHTLLPHEINYRANMWLLRESGAQAVLAVFAVGGIDRALKNGDLVLPAQIVDYTWGRAHTFSGGATTFHADFTDPFAPDLRQRLAAAAEHAGEDVVQGGVYGCTQGPRLETAAEIDRMARDGCTVVGMTAMPEAALARELALPYAGICLVVNPAAGRGDVPITVDDMRTVVRTAQSRLLRLLGACLDGLDG